MGPARTFNVLIPFLVLALAPAAQAQEIPVTPEHAVQAEDDYSPFVDQHFPTRVFWGDTHLHTRNSPDAGFLGNTLSPEDAYRFARGEVVAASGGQRARLVRPLDFLMVADHAEYFGIAGQLIDGDPSLLADPVGRRWYDTFHGSPEGGNTVYQEIIQSSMAAQPRELVSSPLAKRTAWDRNIQAAEAFNEPGRFTALIGFEWSSIVTGDNLHRVVVFRDGADRASQVQPFSMFDGNDPEDLWQYMANYEDETNGLETSSLGCAAIED